MVGTTVATAADTMVVMEEDTVDTMEDTAGK
jgi:hypothetical protein